MTTPLTAVPQALRLSCNFLNWYLSKLQDLIVLPFDNLKTLQHESLDFIQLKYPSRTVGERGAVPGQALFPDGCLQGLL